MHASRENVARAFGGGKVILLGEHGVVYGRPGLAAGIRRGVTATAEVCEHALLQCEPWGVEVECSAERHGGARGEATLAHAFAAVLRDYPELPKVRVRVEIDLPGGAGLGCSAAIGVAVVGALDRFHGVVRSAQEIAEASMAWERVFHGNPSGIDNAVSAMGGVVVFRRDAGVRPVPLARRLWLVVGNSEEPSSTKDMVANVAARHAEDEVWSNRRFDAMAELCGRGERACVGGDLEALGQAMLENQELLRDFDLVTPRLDAMCLAALGARALGAKVTGAGGGGCMVALARDAAAAEGIRDAIAETSGSAFVAAVECSQREAET
ncbi:MAG: mevalonate kinase [Deltaproteobacteria bacterium]|nr:mevalonate kinase [Deltaproteobacteria bacterium]